MSSTRLDRACNIDDLRRIARARVPAPLFDFIDRGSEDETTMHENIAAIERVRLRPRVAIDVSQRSLSSTIFGTRLSMPIALGVTGLSGLFSYDAERCLARAATAAGIPFTIGSMNFTALEEMKHICGELLWFQLYPSKDRSIMRHQIERARAADVRVLQLTLDTPVRANREYLRRSGFRPPSRPTPGAMLQILRRPRWLLGTYLRYCLNGGLPELGNMPPGQRAFFGPTASAEALSVADDLTWDDIRALRREWPNALVIKGISTAEDARCAADCGADGVLVSNHGGRSLDGAIGSLSALPSVVEAVGDRLTVLVDGGFRRGTAVVKGLALGATCVMTGRPALYGVIAGGQAGAARALAILREEIDRTMAYLGCCGVNEINRIHVSMTQ
jgi:isopentenyl diphosphate isomerase/L-lactate dehydrogenase-like FMN-dependent dehydrogenase